MLRTRSASSKLLCSAVLVLALVSLTVAENKTPARILAKQTGATQFEEERFETHADCNEHKHHLKKRSSDEDVDYEVYQGVVGRPGIDFPIYPRIPRTTFSCRSFGNGYFADMDTDCQVFHICEEGRKISFLCPNGTIFQQSELTCDWWFKVNCLGSPGYYAESAEILNKQRVQRVRPSVPVKGFNIVGGGLNIKPKVSNGAGTGSGAGAVSVSPRPTQTNKSERRIDSNEEPGMESVDFDDLSGEKQLKGQKEKSVATIDDNSNDNESQITAESASFVNNKRRNSYTYEKPVAEAQRKPSTAEFRNVGRNGARRANNGERGSQRTGYANPQGNNYNGNESTEKARSGHRGQQRFREDKKPATASSEHSDSTESAKDGSRKLEITPKSVTPVEVQPKSNKGSISAEAETQSPRSADKPKAITPAYPSGTYSTARRLDSTRTTPYYTPTVPSVGKSKTNVDGKIFYVKGKANSVTYAAVTPNPNRFNNGGLFLESTATPRGSAVNTATTEAPPSTTFRAFIIGMRHHDSASPPSSSSSGEVHRFSLTANNAFKAELPTQKAPHKTESRDYLPTTTPASASTGPTYLPKSAASPKSLVDEAAGDFLLFAPDPVKDESVTRNVDEMLKAVNLIKDKFEDVEGISVQPSTGSSRVGLDIPPSSGPDVLVSLAKYFAGEPSEATGTNSPNSLINDKFSKPRGSSPSSSTFATAPTTTNKQAPPASKPSDTTASITTASPAAVSSNADDIKASLLSDRTVTRYSDLFGLKEPQGIKGRDSTGDSQATNDPEGRNKQKDSPVVLFPQIGTTDASIRELAEKPESRKIAQVFSNALTTYLEDPKTFREQLAAVRPTEPPSVSGRPNFVPVTATDPTLFRSGSGATYLPTRPTPAIDFTTTQASIAAEINNNFDYSTQHPDLTSTTEFSDSTTTFRPIFGSDEKKLRLDASSELLPPGQDSAEGDEFLQRQQTQSFVKSRNSLTSSQENKRSSKPNGSGGSNERKQASTENPWNHISSNDFLDPLTINDGLMKEAKTTTIGPFAYSPKESSTASARRAHGKQDILAADTQRGHLRVGSAEVTTQRGASSARSAETAAEPDTWHDIFNSYDLPRETLPSNSGLQRIANKLFGGLNETEALHLKNVMQQAEHNRQVLSLLLLLIQTCDDNNGKALERSRKHLLNALIDMDGKLHSGKDKVKGTATATTTTTPASVSATTTLVPVTTFRRSGDNFYTSTTAQPSTTTDQPATPTTTTTATSVEETTKFEIRVEDPDTDFTSSGAATTAATTSRSSSDKRALELLKSLYSLASKFTSRR